MVYYTQEKQFSFSNLKQNKILEVHIMSLTTRKNLSVKALQSKLAKEKKNNVNVMLEWEISCNTNIQRGKVYKQTELMNLYDRDSEDGEYGATKTCHLKSHIGNEFKYIVVKRHQTNGFIPGGVHNQLIDEVNFWNMYAEKNEADYLCPILKYFTSKSDKVTATSETMQNNVIIIAQKALFVGSAKEACDEAEYLNEMEGYSGIDTDTRYKQLEHFANINNWWDVMENSGNSGVIFDYSLNCYKAVFIDYAL
jgi:hypothetical protein